MSAESKRTLSIALAGNPNSGKTTVFNALTGARQHVGNYAGVTVEKKEGSATHDGIELKIVDLPGTYSLTAYSIEEIVARNFVLDEAPDVVVDIIDASNLERNLYLATQFMELGVPLVLAFNMSDVAEARGYRIDDTVLSKLMGVPIVRTIGHKGRGIDELVEAIVAVANGAAQAVENQRHPDYGGEVEPRVQQLTDLIAAKCDPDRHRRWFGVKLLENDEETIKRLGRLCGDEMDHLLAEAKRRRDHVESICGDSAEIVLADRRYGFISGACTEAVTQTVEARHARSDKIDAVLTHRALGLPIFAVLMYLMFQLTFSLGETPMSWIEAGFAWLGATVSGFWPDGSDSLLKSLLVEGVIHGVGGVLVFLPNIVLLFLAIAFLEDTGYMARAAFIMDRLMHKIGLHGKSFIPMLTGFGCSVPAILATRTLESRHDRMTTMMVIPLMSCGARLPIYTLIIPAFFPQTWRAPVLFSVYLVGILLAVICAKLLRATVFKGESTPFVMELPPYRVPTLKGLCVHAGERSWGYLHKAGTVILAFAICLWAASTFPRKTQFERDYQAETAAAEADYLAATQAMQSRLQLPDTTNLLADTIAAGQADTDGPATLIRLMRIRQAIVNARADFDDAVAEGDLAADSPAAAERERIRDAAIDRASQIDPVLHAEVITHMDDVRRPRDKRLAKIANAMQAETLSYTISGRVGRWMAPALRPMGFDWRIGTALIGALGAKEVFVAQLGIAYAVGETDERSDSLRRRLQEDYTPLTAYCIMLFCLVTAPCVATIAVTGRESQSWKWALFQVAGLSILAYVLTTAVYQIGSLFT